MKSLYINTTEKNLSLAFNDNGKIKTFLSNGEKSQSEEIFTAISNLLDKTKIKDLDFIVCLGGPGSFTGIRLGLSLVKGFNIATNIPIIILNNFKSIYYSLKNKTNEFYITIPAGINDIYVAKFDDKGNEICEHKIIKKDELNVNDSIISDVIISPEKVLLEVEKFFDKEKFVQEPIEPTYIKPHYAKIKNKNSL